MSFELTSISSRASISSAESSKPGIREKLLALRQKAALAAVDATDPAFADSFGDQLSDLDGRRRWLLDGLAREKWNADLKSRVGEILRVNEGEIYKGRPLQRTATVSHCWMLGFDETRAHPTVVISCNQSTILKKTMRIISQHGVLKDSKFVLRGIPFCDLRHRMDAGKEVSGIDEASIPMVSEAQGDADKDSARSLHMSPSNNQNEPEDQKFLDRGLGLDEKAFKGQAPGDPEKGAAKGSKEKKALEDLVLMQHDMESSELDSPPLRVGAEEITVPASGRLTTLGGFIMVDGICFGLTTAHAFTEEEEDDHFGQRSVSEYESVPHLYDSDWANEDSSDGDDTEVDSRLISDFPKDRMLQRTRCRYVAGGQKYRSETGEMRRITASSQNFSADGLDWALCELGEWGKYAINGVYLPPELRTDEKREYLLFNKLKTMPPLGKILVATRRGVIPGYGTGSDTSIKLGGDDTLRHVWSIQLEESLCPGDSGSWVVDATSGDVYGVVIAGSTGLREEYIVPAVEIGQDIRHVMRADEVRLPNWQDVVGTRTNDSSSTRYKGFTSNNRGLDWDSDESLEDDMLDEDEERSLLAEMIKHSSINVEIIAKMVKDAGIRPKWSRMALPKGRSVRTAQKAVDRLLTGYRSRKKLVTEDKASTISDQEPYQELISSRDASPSKIEQPLLGEPPELLDSNPNFRAEKSRRAWRAKRQAARGPKPHHRKHHRNKKSGEASRADPVLRAPGSVESPNASHQTKFEMDSEDEQDNLDPDIILVRHRGSIYNAKFPAFSIAEKSLLVGQLRQQVARDFSIDDTSRVTLVFKGKNLKVDSRTCHEEGLMMRSEILCVVKRTPREEIEFLSNKFRTELVPQGIEFISNTPVDGKKREFDYRKISETILTQILLKSDSVETEGDTGARTLRKALADEVNSFLGDLDIAAKKDAPSHWHADFLEQRGTPEQRRPSMNIGSPPLSSRSSNFRKNSNDRVVDDNDP